jgi:hypothetical protein
MVNRMTDYLEELASSLQEDAGTIQEELRTLVVCLHFGDMDILDTGMPGPLAHIGAYVRERLQPGVDVDLSRLPVAPEAGREPNTWAGEGLITVALDQLTALVYDVRAYWTLDRHPPYQGVLYPFRTAACDRPWLRAFHWTSQQQANAAAAWATWYATHNDTGSPAN